MFFCIKQHKIRILHLQLFLFQDFLKQNETLILISRENFSSCHLWMLGTSTQWSQFSGNSPKSKWRHYLSYLQHQTKLELWVPWPEEITPLSGNLLTVIWEQRDWMLSHSLRSEKCLLHMFSLSEQGAFVPKTEGGAKETKKGMVIVVSFYFPL